MTKHSAATKRASRSPKAAPVEFGGREIDFDWTNDQWAMRHLPLIRIAVAHLSKDKVELKTIVESFLKADDGEEMVCAMIEDWVSTKEHLETLAKLIESALARTFCVLDEIPGAYADTKPAVIARAA